MVHAAFISSKFRFLAFALLFGAAPLVLMRKYVAPPEHWLFAMFIFHLSSAIALYYLLKFVQEKLFPAFSKRWRTVSTAFVLLLMLGHARHAHGPGADGGYARSGLECQLREGTVGTGR